MGIAILIAASAAGCSQKNGTDRRENTVRQTNADEYYGPEPSQEAYDRLHELYELEGLSEEEIAQLLVLDIKESSYFERQGITNQHGGGGVLFSKDEEMMGCLGIELQCLETGNG